MKHIPQPKEKNVSFEVWLDKILTIHPPPTILMIEIDEDGKFSLLGASSNVEAMNLILDQKAQRNPIAY